MSAAVPAVRTVVVGPPSALGELARVGNATMAVLIGTLMYLGTDSPLLRGEPVDASTLLPYQQLIAGRPSAEQLMFRELQEGLLEAETRRTGPDGWPDVTALAEEGIPPFALDPTSKSGPYDWRLVHDGTVINYLGVPKRAGDPAWLVLVTEPLPGGPPDNSPDDQDHDRLIDGTVLHVGTWVRTDGQPIPGIVRAPSNEGWTQLYAVEPPSLGVLAPGSPAAAQAPPIVR